jgi:hypothetical protein
VLGSATANVSVALGSTNGTFKPAVTYPATTTTGAAQTIALGDFDGDGKTDIASLLVGGAGVGILKGRGDGTFNSPTTASVPNPSGGLLAQDFNGDGFVDLATASGGNQIAVLLNKGNGTFFAPTNTPVAGTAIQLNSLRTADFNGDGIPDLAAISASAQLLCFVFLGKGDGTFTNVDQKVIPASAIYNLAIADVNGDGRPDIVVASYTTVTILENLGDGTFAPPLQFTATSVGSVVSGDFNKDGKADVLAFGGDGHARILLNETLFLPPVPSLSWLATHPARLVWYTHYAGYNLEYAPELGGPWQAPTGAPTVVDCQYFYTIPTGSSGFYRLHKP